VCPKSGIDIDFEALRSGQDDAAPNTNGASPASTSQPHATPPPPGGLWADVLRPRAYLAELPDTSVDGSMAFVNVEKINLEWFSNHDEALSLVSIHIVLNSIFVLSLTLPKIFTAILLPT
jgi:hypothetical protein